MFAIADCNNFYASCERVFQPKLNHLPIIVLSNNDGCVIARSNEAKALGIKMGAPYFKIEQFAKQENIKVFSSNYALYGDMSQRVMQVLSQYAPRIEVYSIDECFLDLTGFQADLTSYCVPICKVVKQWTGIPISIGIAPTKTLAKLANRLAKQGQSKHGSVLDWSSIDEADVILASIALDDIWGISRRWTEKLQQIGIHNALQLKRANVSLLRKQFGVVMERIVMELNGISCIALEEMPSPKKQILTSRSFGEKLTEYHDVRAAVTHFATRSAEKLRRQKMTTQTLTVFIQTSPFDKNPQYANSATLQFDCPTNNSSLLVEAANHGLAQIFKSGFFYQRAGVLLPELWAEGVEQISLFDVADSTKSKQLMRALDDINKKHGKRSIVYGSKLLSRRWQMRQQYKSPSYTTNIMELMTIQI